MSHAQDLPAPSNVGPSSNPWLGVLSLAFGAFAVVTAEFLPVGILPEVAQEFGISSGTAGLMMALPGITAAIAAPGVMLVSGALDRRVVLMALSLLVTMACALAAVAGTYELMLLSRALSGLSLGAFWAMAIAVAGRLVPAQQSHKAVAAVFSGVTAAMIFGVPLGTLVSQSLSWRAAFAVGGGIGLIALVLQALFLPRLPTGAAVRVAAFGEVLKASAARHSLGLVMLVFSAHFGTYTYLAPKVAEAGLVGSQVTWLLLGYGAMGLASNFVASHFAARNLMGTALTALAMFATATAGLAWLMPTAASVIALVLLWGVAWGMLPLCLSLNNTRATPKGAEAGAAMFTLVTQVSIATGSWLGGLLVDQIGSSAAYGSAAALAVIAAVLLRRQRPAAA